MMEIKNLLQKKSYCYFSEKNIVKLILNFTCCVYTSVLVFETVTEIMVIFFQITNSVYVYVYIYT